MSVWGCGVTFEPVADFIHAKFPRAFLWELVVLGFGLQCGTEFLRRSDGVEGGVEGFDAHCLAEVKEVLLLIRRNLFGGYGAVDCGGDLLELELLVFPADVLGLVAGGLERGEFRVDGGLVCRFRQA